MIYNGLSKFLSSHYFRNTIPIMPTLNRLLLLTLIIPLTACQPTQQATDAPNDDTQTVTQTTEATADTESTAINATPLTILALGDSLTEGLGVPEDEAYPAQLEAKLHAMGYTGVTVVNSGLSGETSSGLVSRLDWVTQTNPDITILTIGANDAMRGIDVATVDSNIRTAIAKLQEKGSTGILGGMQIYDNLGEGSVTDFARIYPKIAEDTGVSYIPFFLNGVAGDASLNQGDAIHPTADGYAVVVEDNILPVLEPALLKELQAEEVD